LKPLDKAGEMKLKVSTVLHSLTCCSWEHLDISQMPGRNLCTVTRTKFARDNRRQCWTRRKCFRGIYSSENTTTNRAALFLVLNQLRQVLDSLGKFFQI
jgi:hypothetical protein